MAEQLQNCNLDTILQLQNCNLDTILQGNMTTTSMDILNDISNWNSPISGCTTTHSELTPRINHNLTPREAVVDNNTRCALLISSDMNFETNQNPTNPKWNFVHGTTAVVQPFPGPILDEKIANDPILNLEDILPNQPFSKVVMGSLAEKSPSSHEINTVIQAENTHIITPLESTMNSEYSYSSSIGTSTNNDTPSEASNTQQNFLKRKRGRKPKSESDLTSTASNTNKVKKRKLYEQEPFQDKKLEGKRIAAVRSKKYRDEKNNAMKRLKSIEDERDQLLSQVVKMRSIEDNLRHKLEIYETYIRNQVKSNEELLQNTFV